MWGTNSITMQIRIQERNVMLKNRTKSFANKYCTESCFTGLVDGILQCKCGEEADNFDWKFEKDENAADIVLSNENRDILFHPTYSHGTAALRGDRPFQKNKHYYWEVKMISSLYGTDVMVGVGKANLDLSKWRYQFCSILGLDLDSWGYSYKGKIQHGELRRKYGTEYGIGSLIGVHLDTWMGTLEYYVNRRPMGVAFDNLKGAEVYPMLSSTAAKSVIRVTCATTEEPTLQLYCLKVVMKNASLYKEYKQELPQIARIYDRKYFWIRPAEDVQAEALAVRRKKRERLDTYVCLSTDEDCSSDEDLCDDSSTTDIYSGLDEDCSRRNSEKKLRRNLDLSDCLIQII